MPKVKVFNDNVYPYDVMFKGDPVHIDSKDYWKNKDGTIKEVDIFEAADLKGTYRAPGLDGGGKPLNNPKFYSMLRVEPLDGAVAKVPAAELHKCMAPECKFMGSDAQELAAHSDSKHDTGRNLVLPEEDAEIEAKKVQKASKKTA